MRGIAGAIARRQRRGDLCACSVLVDKIYAWYLRRESARGGEPTLDDQIRIDLFERLFAGKATDATSGWPQPPRAALRGP